MRGVSPGLPLGEAGSRHEVDGRLMRVTIAKQPRHSSPLPGPSLKGGLSFGLPLGEAGSCRETDGRLKRVFYFLCCPGCDTCPVYFCGVQPGFES